MKNVLFKVLLVFLMLIWFGQSSRGNDKGIVGNAESSIQDNGNKTDLPDEVSLDDDDNEGDEDNSDGIVEEDGGYCEPAGKEFDSKRRNNQQSAEKSVFFRYLDVVVLTGLLGLTCWLVYGRKKRKYLLIVLGVSLLYLGFYRSGCICPVGATGNVAMTLRYFKTTRISIFAALFFLIPLIFSFF